MSDQVHKLVVLGGGGVGKSCLTIQFLQKTFVKEYDPTIQESYSTQLVLDGKPVQVEIQDTAGQEEYTGIQDPFIRSGDGFLMVYSITHEASFQELELTRERILRVKERKDVPMILVGNKSDLSQSSRVVRLEDGQERSRQWFCPFMETSAKTRSNVDEAFMSLVREVSNFKKRAPPAPRKKGCLVQ